jgi:hypothetical protein
VKRDLPTFKTEAELCDLFIASVPKAWTVYPETGGFDILLVENETGRQLGIEAKLRLNAKVIEQILPDGAWYLSDRGPDFRAIIVPACERGFDELLGIIGIEVFTPHKSYRGGHGWRFDIFGDESRPHNPIHWFDHNPQERCELPAYVPTVRAGVPAPVRLTEWKIGALRVLAVLELDGCVTRREIRDCGVDPRRFCAADGWLEQVRDGVWSRGKVPAFDKQHAGEYAQILAELREKRAA